MTARREPRRALACALAVVAGLACAVSVVGVVAFHGGAARAQEERGTWRFEAADKPVKVVVIGGSVAAYPAGGFPQWLPGVCSNIEVVNKAKAKLGAVELRQRFVAQVLENRRLDADTKKSTWLVFLGGLNSVGSPEVTNSEVAKTFKAAKDAGLKTLGVSINPWGSADDHRWQGIDGLAYLEHTQRTVDFLMGRLTPTEAFGPAAAAKRVTATPGIAAALDQFAPGELPDIAVDVWDGPLRHLDATLRDPARLAREARRSAFVKKRLATVAEAERPALLDKLVALAAELPRWFMRPDFVGFDAIHPNASGHREIAKAICAKAPSEWDCDCGALERLAWDRRTNKPKAL